MNYIKSIKTVTELPALSPTLVKEIEENANAFLCVRSSMDWDALKNN